MRGILLAGLALLGSVHLYGEDPQPFSPRPLQLAISPAELNPQRIDHVSQVPLPIGPVRIDYGVPLRGDEPRGWPGRMDAPGPGYRQHRNGGRTKAGEV